MFYITNRILPLLCSVAILVNVTSAALVQSASGTCSDQKVDIGFLLDASASEGRANFQKQVDFVKAFVQQLNVGPSHAQVGLSTFDTNVHLQFYLNHYNDKASTLTALDNVPYTSGATYTQRALESMRTDFFIPANGARGGVPKVLILLTDGQSTSPAETAREAQLLKQSGVHCIVVGIGTSLGTTELESIASGLENVIQVSAFDQLLDNIMTMTSLFCNYVSTAGHGQGTTSPTNNCGVRPPDVVFVLDSSGSEGPQNFQKQLDFVANITAQLSIGPNDTQVSLLTFSTNVHNKFYLNEYNTVFSVLTAISKVPFESGATYTGQALHFVRLNTLSTYHGRRNNSQPIVIVMTDGQSSDKTVTVQEASLLRSTGAEVIAIGIGSNTDSHELQQIASDPTHVFNVVDFDYLSSISRQLLEYTCAGVGPTQTVRPECGFKPADIVFLMDSSSSLSVAEFDKMKEFVSTFAQLFQIGPNNVQISVVVFSTSARVEFYLNTYQEQFGLQAGIAKSAYWSGATHTDQAFDLVLSDVLTTSNGARPGATKTVILLTDGQSFNSRDTIAKAELVKQSGAQVITVGIGPNVDQNELEQVASDVQHAFAVVSVDTLKSIRDELVSTACEVCSDTLSADILLVLDCSTEAGQGNFVREVSFATSFLNQFNIGPDDVRFAALTYASLPNAEFWFNSYMDRREMIFALQTLRYSQGTANLAGALRFARDYMFDPNHGARTNKPHYAIVISDGQSDDVNATINEASRLKQDGVVVMSVGVGSGVDKNELTTIATAPSLVFFVPDYTALNALYQDVRRATCKSYNALPSGHTTVDPVLVG